MIKGQVILTKGLKTAKNAVLDLKKINYFDPKFTKTLKSKGNGKI